jgi:predicted dehydrogenase
MKIRIGFIGTGFAKLVQIPAFMNCAETEIVSIASGSLANAEKTAQQFGIKHFTDNWRETVENTEVDLVCITTPPNLHYEQTLHAIARGKHILCEKPMAMNAAEALEMTTKAKNANLLALIDHELRFLNGRRKAFDLIRDGEIGKIIHFKTMFRNASRGTQSVKWNWWSDEKSGGGALGAIGSHAFDTFRWMIGTEISEVFCQLKTNVKERIDANGELKTVTTDDEANLIVKFADSNLTADASGTVSLSVVESGKYEHRLEIFGTKGSIIVEEGGEIWLSKMSDDKWKQIEIDLGEPPPNTKVGGWSRGFMNFAKEIVFALQEGKTEVPNAATFEDGYKCQLVLDAAIQSNATKSMIKIQY